MLLNLSNETRSKLSNIEKYTAETWGEKQSKAYIKSFTDKFELIATLPHLGRFLFARDGF